MGTTGDVSLKILGDSLNFDEISEQLRLIPTMVCKKGTVYNKTVGAAENDCWYYEIEIFASGDIKKALRKQLSILETSQEYIKFISEKYHIRMRCSIQSEWAQIFFDISPDLIRELAALNIGLEFSILSFGGVE